VQRDQVLTFAQYLNRAKSKQLHPDPGSSVGDVLYIKLQRQFFRPTLIPKPLNRAAPQRAARECRSEQIHRARRRSDRGRERGCNERGHERLWTLHLELLRRGAATTYSIRGVIARCSATR